MLRYLRVLRLFWATALAAEMEYRLNFAIAALTSVSGLIGSLFWLSLFFRSGESIGGWSWPAAMLVLGLFTLMQGMSATLLDANLSRIVSHVEKGTLDFVLLKPIDSQFWLSLRNLSPWGLPDLVMGVSLLLYAGRRLDFSAEHYLRGLIPVLLAMVVLYSLWFILGATSIWFVKVYNVTEVLRGLLETGRFPITAYPVAVRVIFTTVVPVAFMTTVPARAMLGEAGLAWLAATAALALAMFAFSRWFWRLALRYYTSASS
jgi:ABC-2 type transport system permease protein